MRPFRLLRPSRNCPHQCSQSTCYYCHCVRWGKGEGAPRQRLRLPEGPRYKGGRVDYSADFEPEYYLENNGDVRSAYTKTTYGEVSMLGESPVLRHYASFGMREGRRGDEAFDVYGYKTRFLDLRHAYGNDLRAYYNHYLRYKIIFNDCFEWQSPFRKFRLIFIIIMSLC